MTLVAKFYEACSRSLECVGRKDFAGSQHAIGQAYVLFERAAVELRARGELGQIAEMQEQHRTILKQCRAVSSALREK